MYWAKCKQSKYHTSFNNFISLCLKLIISWLNMSIGGQGHVFVCLKEEMTHKLTILGSHTLMWFVCLLDEMTYKLTRLGSSTLKCVLCLVCVKKVNSILVHGWPERAIGSHQRKTDKYEVTDTIVVWVVFQVYLHVSVKPIGYLDFGSNKWLTRMQQKNQKNIENVHERLKKTRQGN